MASGWSRVVAWVAEIGFILAPGALEGVEVGGGGEPVRGERRCEFFSGCRACTASSSKQMRASAAAAGPRLRPGQGPPLADAAVVPLFPMQSGESAPREVKPILRSRCTTSRATCRHQPSNKRPISTCDPGGGLTGLVLAPPVEGRACCSARSAAGPSCPASSLRDSRRDLRRQGRTPSLIRQDHLQVTRRTNFFGLTRSSPTMCATGMPCSYIAAARSALSHSRTFLEARTTNPGRHPRRPFRRRPADGANSRKHADFTVISSGQGPCKCSSPGTVGRMLIGRRLPAGKSRLEVMAGVLRQAE